MITYDFDTSLPKGNQGEAKLDLHFSQWFVVEPVSMWMQKHGVDRVFTRKDNGLQFLVEYKSDDRAAKTDNAFIETISRDNDHIPGWVYTSWAQLLVYYIPPTDEVILIPMLTVKLGLSTWSNTCKRKIVPNRTYNTIGLIVPLRVLRGRCIRNYSKQ